MFKFFIYKFGQFCVNRLPLPVAYSIASFLSDLHYWFSFRDRRAVKNNLKVIMGPEADVSFVAREVFRNFGKYLVEFFCMAKNLNGDYIQRNVEIKNLDRLENVLKKGKGGIILTAHIGNWEMGGMVLSKLGYCLMGIALPHKERPVNDLFNQQRQSQGITVVQTNIAVRRCLEMLKDNGLIALLADRDFSLNGEVMNFLNRKALIPKGAAVFSVKTLAPILPTFFIRQANDRFVLIFEEPIQPPEGTHADEEDRYLQLMRRYTDVMEEKIKAYPSQWLMFREFWIK